MKIALVVQNSDRRNGGAEQYTLDLARSLTLRGHQVTVVAAHGPAAVAETAAAAGYKVMYLGASGRTRWMRLKDFLNRTRDLYEGHAYEVVHAMLPVWRCDVYQPHAGLATDLLATGHMKHPHYIIQRLSRVANHMNPKRVGLARIETSLMAHQPPPWVLCFSSMMREWAQTHFDVPAEHLVMLTNGIDLAKFDPTIGARSRQAIREEWKIGADQRLGLLVGHNWKLKGVRESIEALQMMGARGGGQRVVLMVVGRDDARGYRELAEKAGVGDRVIFMGSVTDPRPLYGAADFLLLPSRRDTCSLVVLEALAMGLPVITTRQNGASEVIDHGRQGIIMERGDKPALVKALKTMLDPTRLRQMSREAIALRGKLSFEHHVGVVEGVYRKVLAERAGLKTANVPA
jgi:UDP-glucose:(heptosyl)LPS alpha-1,3-glucosyltransferase